LKVYFQMLRLNLRWYFNYLQVTMRLDPPEKLEQETRPLLKTGDAFDKYLVTMDRVLFPMLENGIKVRNIVDFLLNPFA